MIFHYQNLRSKYLPSMNLTFPIMVKSLEIKKEKYVMSHSRARAIFLAHSRQMFLNKHFTPKLLQ